MDADSGNCNVDQIRAPVQVWILPVEKVVASGPHEIVHVKGELWDDQEADDGIDHSHNQMVPPVQLVQVGKKLPQQLDPFDGEKDLQKWTKVEGKISDVHKVKFEVREGTVQSPTGLDDDQSEKEPVNQPSTPQPEAK